MQNFTRASERPLLVVDAQPPLLDVDRVRLVEHEDEDNQELSLVLIVPYVNEMQYGQPYENPNLMRNPPITFDEGKFNMDLNMLMFIANQARMPATQDPK